MIEIKVPGRADYTIENIVFDYNGTIAVNGMSMCLLQIHTALPPGNAVDLI